MLNANHGFAAKAGGLLLAGGLAIAGLAIAAPAAADEPKTQTKEIRTVIIENDGKGPQHMTIDSDHPGKMAANCPGILTEVATGPSGTADKKEQPKIVICSAGGSKEEAAKGLERALAHVEQNDEMSADGGSRPQGQARRQDRGTSRREISDFRIRNGRRCGHFPHRRFFVYKRNRHDYICNRKRSDSMDVRLSEAEWDVMEVLWSSPQPLTATDIDETLSKGDRDWSLATVKSLLSRLLAKKCGRPRQGRPPLPLFPRHRPRGVRGARICGG